MERENQRIMLTKRLLKESLLRLLERKELDKISITELCREAGINRATFYRHYEIPRDILNELGKDLFYEMHQTVGIPRSKSDVKGSIENLCTFMEKNLDRIRIIIKGTSETDFTAFVSDLYTEFWEEIRRVSILSGLSDEDIKLLVLYSAGGSYFVLRNWLLGNIQKDSKEMADYLFRLLSRPDWSSIFDNIGLLYR